MKQVVLPLCTHWRTPAPRVRKGCSPPMEPTAHFCASNASYEAQLCLLHEQLRNGRPVQAEIDRYLVVALGPHLDHLLLPRCNVPHYDNLPDMFPFILGVFDAVMDQNPELQQMLLMMRQCMPLRRRTRRSQREVEWREGSFPCMQILVRCLLGTLLDLYNVSAHVVCFKTRVAVYQLVRSLLVLDFACLRLCLNRMRYILKISIMEYLCNSIQDYFPAIEYMLNKSGRQFSQFKASVNNLCNLFRCELNTMFLSSPTGILDKLPTLEKLAHSYFERCTRSYRGIITSTFGSVPRGRLSLTSAALSAVLDRVYSTKNQVLFASLHRDVLPPEMLEAAWHVTQAVQVQLLPAAILRRQYACLSRKCAFNIGSSRYLHLCAMCVLQRPGAVMTLRLDCETSRFICTHADCGTHSVLRVDMLGRLVTVGQQTVLLSCCCGCPVLYRGSGSEFATECGAHCQVKFNGVQRRAPAEAQQQQVKPLGCHICQQTVVAQQLDVLDVRLRQIVQRRLCGRHQLSEALAERVLDTVSFEKTLDLNSKARRRSSRG